jgi:hypothetical protein
MSQIRCLCAQLAAALFRLLALNHTTNIHRHILSSRAVSVSGNDSVHFRVSQEARTFQLHGILYFV